VRRRGSHIFLENRFTDSGEAVRLTRRPPFTAKKIPGTYLLQRLSRSEGPAGRIISIKNPMTSTGIEPAIFMLVE
jgi:hypothetical protein